MTRYVLARVGLSLMLQKNVGLLLGRKVAGCVCETVTFRSSITQEVKQKQQLVKVQA